MKTLTLKRIIALLFAIIMVLSVVACTKNPDEPKESDKPTEAVTNPTDDSQEPGDTEETEEIYTSAKSDYEEGTTISFLFPDAQTENKYSICNDIWIESMTGDVLADAVWKRNELLKSSTGITVSYVMNNGKMLDALKQDQASGDYVYEVIGPSYNDVVAFFNSQLIADISTLGFNMSYSWFEDNCAEIFTINGKQFAMSSSITFLDKVSCPAVIFNKTLVEDNQFGDLYQMVIDKTWNWNEMLRMAEVVTSGNVDDGEYTMDDFYGISSQNDFSYYMLHSTGLTTVVKNEKGEFVYNGKNEILVDCLVDIYTVMANSNIFLNRQGTVGSTQDIPAILDHFAAGKSLFLIRPVESLFGLRDRTDEFGVIPMPLYYEGQDEYYSATNTYVAAATCFTNYIPKDRYQKVNDAIQVLAMQSNKLVMPALYEVCLGSRLVNDKNASAMLDIIFLNKTYDFGFIFNIGSIRTYIVQKHASVKRAIGNIGTALGSIDKVVEQKLTFFMNQVNNYNK